MDTPRSSLTEIQGLLESILKKLESMPVSAWMSEEQADPARTGEVIGLMLQVGTRLMEEVDAFLDMMSLTEESADGKGRVVTDPNADLFDLPADEEEASTRSPALE